MEAAIAMGLGVALLGLVLAGQALRAAVWVYNALTAEAAPPPAGPAADYSRFGYVPLEVAREPAAARVPVPSGLQSVGYAITLVVVLGITQAVVRAVTAGYAQMGARSPGEVPSNDLAAQLVGLPVGLVVMGFVLSRLLPARFSQGLGVAAVVHVAAFLVGIAAVVLVTGLRFAP